MIEKQTFVEYKDHMGTDLTVVNAARASFGKESWWLHTFGEGETESHPILQKSDENLIRFLATGYRTAEWTEFLQRIRQLVIDDFQMSVISDHRLTEMLHDYKKKAQHWAPFAHPQVQIRMSIPIFLARQFVKHQVGGVWSEESRRYLSDEPEVWFPQEWHSRPEDIKQGSGGLVKDQKGNSRIARHSVENALEVYKDMVTDGVAPEEARIVLPLNMMTTVVWTGSLLFWARVYNQRVDSHAQLAAQEVGKKLGSIIEPLFPYSWKALTT